MIAKAEGVNADEGVLELILRLANGDLRKAITYLQTAQRLHGSTNPPTPVSTISSESGPSEALRLIQQYMRSQALFQKRPSTISFE